MSDKQYAVIGLGRFGLSVCKELQSSGAQVLAVDIDEERVKEAAAFVSQAIVANCTSEETVKELRLDDYDMVMVSIGSDVNSSILTTLVVKESGAKAVWVKANDKFHGKFFLRLVPTISLCLNETWGFVLRVKCWIDAFLNLSILAAV